MAVDLVVNLRLIGSQMVQFTCHLTRLNYGKWHNDKTAANRPAIIVMPLNSHYHYGKKLVE
jgi:hypothetical protein